MKLSIISLVGNSAKDVGWFLQDLSEQTNQDFEIILVINKNSEAKAICETVANFLSVFKSRLVVLFNTKYSSYQFNLLSAYRLAKGEYCVVINSDNSLKNHYVAKIQESIPKFPEAEILEFKPRLVGTTCFKPKARITEKILLDLNTNSFVYAYSYPFIFNKIIKTKLVKKIIKLKLEHTNDSKLCTYLNYLLLLEAKKYVYLDFRIYREYFATDMWLNTTNILNSMEEIEALVQVHNLKLKQEITYAKYYLVKLLISGFLTETSYLYKTLSYLVNTQISERRSQKIIEKHIKVIEKLENQSEYTNFIHSNLYMLRNNEEVEQLNKPIKKIIKNKILASLE